MNFIGMRAVFLTTSLMFIYFNTAIAQSNGTISGRVITEEGGGLANVTIGLTSADANRMGANLTTSTDEEGNFQFANLTPRSYTIYVNGLQGYVHAPSAAERNTGRRYHIGDQVTFTLVKGGVITGRVTDAAGDPVVEILVYAMKVRDADGNPVRYQPTGGAPHMTDDRGIYRIYGLAPGSYIVGTSGRSFSPLQSPYFGDVPTFHPSSTIDTAGEVSVASGAEITGVDIRHLSNPGRAISGKVTGSPPSSNPYSVGASISIYNVATGVSAGSSYVRPGESEAYAVYGIPDGEYEVIARIGGFEGREGFASRPRRVTVRGSDVTGVDLALTPLSSISGKVVLEINPSVCPSKPKSVMEDLVISARRDDKTRNEDSPFQYLSGNDAVNEKGEFTVQNLDATLYRLAADLPNETWYLKSITGPAASPAPARRSAAASGGADVSRTGISLKSGEKVTGVTVTIADGAAGLEGKVVAEGEGEKIPPRQRIYLIPAEPAAADEILRYAETQMRSGGSFAFKNIIPGKYLLLARPIPGNEPVNRPIPPAIWDSAERAKLRKDAAAKKLEIELKPCQRLNDVLLK